jgi:hypothetical protein
MEAVPVVKVWPDGSGLFFSITLFFSAAAAGAINLLCYAKLQGGELTNE